MASLHRKEAMPWINMTLRRGALEKAATLANHGSASTMLSWW